jgi:hypothetical protein
MKLPELEALLRTVVDPHGDIDVPALSDRIFELVAAAIEARRNSYYLSLGAGVVYSILSGAEASGRQATG